MVIKNPIKTGQRGSALLVALIMLLVLTLLSVGGMQDSIIEERMSSNFIDKDMARQAAESAVRSGENWLAGELARPEPQTLSSCTGSCRDDIIVWDKDVIKYMAADGSTSGTATDLKDRSEIWWQTNGETFDAARLSRVNTAPAYAIEFEGYNLPDANGRVEVTDPEEQANQIGPHWYQFTARAQGMSDRSESVLEVINKQRY